MIHRFDITVSLGSNEVDMPIAIDDVSKELYVHTGVSGIDNETAVILGAAHDGVKIIPASTMHNGKQMLHSLVPLSWIEREFGKNSLCQFRAYKARVFAVEPLAEVNVQIQPSTLPVVLIDPSLKPFKGFGKRK